MNTERQKSSYGLTLMELAIAMLIFLIGILGLLQLVVVGVGLNQRSRDITLATSLAQAKADELLQKDFHSPSLDRGGVIPTIAEMHPIADNPAPVSGFVDFFDYKGIPVGSVATPSGTPANVPAKTYFVRQWQVWSCNCGSSPDICTQSCAPADANDLLKKITVTVTSISPAFQGSYPSTTVVVYKTRLG
jgi:Tfp pilus assembly protein PilV